jgi:hypothetical protein
MHRRTPPILLSVLAATLVSMVGRPLEAKPSKPRDVMEVQILEYESDSKKPTRERTLTVPVSGKISGWADLFDEDGICVLQSSPREQVVRLDLRCSTRPSNFTILQLEVDHSFVRDEPTLVGVVDTDEDRRIEVIATRR